MARRRGSIKSSASNEFNRRAYQPASQRRTFKYGSENRGQPTAERLDCPIVSNIRRWNVSFGDWRALRRDPNFLGSGIDGTVLVILSDLDGNQGHATISLGLNPIIQPVKGVLCSPFHADIIVDDQFAGPLILE